jgi:hypothetical protein
VLRSLKRPFGQLISAILPAAGKAGSTISVRKRISPASKDINVELSELLALKSDSSANFWALIKMNHIETGGFRHQLSSFPIQSGPIPRDGPATSKLK